MADKLIKDLDAAVSVASTDLLIVADPTTGIAKKIPVSLLPTGGSVFVEDTHFIGDGTSGDPLEIDTTTEAARIQAIIDLYKPEISATHAAINSRTQPRLVYVTADETNNGDTSLYIHNGTTLKFLQTIA